RGGGRGLRGRGPVAGLGAVPGAGPADARGPAAVPAPRRHRLGRLRRAGVAGREGAAGPPGPPPGGHAEAAAGAEASAGPDQPGLPRLQHAPDADAVRPRLRSLRRLPGVARQPAARSRSQAGTRVGRPCPSTTPWTVTPVALTWPPQPTR